MRASAYPVAILATLLAGASAPLWAQALDEPARQPLPVSAHRPADCTADARLAAFGLREPSCRAQPLRFTLPNLAAGTPLRRTR